VHKHVSCLPRLRGRREGTQCPSGGGVVVLYVTGHPYVGPVPRISTFYGITIAMFFGDHNPPHFHAYYGGSRARFALEGRMLDGDFPRRARRLVRSWARLHGEELAEYWEQVRRHEAPGTIDPLP
jgi:hypothetical protein